MKNFLVTVNYAQVLHENSRESFQDAARRWGAEYFEINEEVFIGPISAPAMKLKAFDLCDADRILMIDADTVISAQAPNPFELFSEDAFVACVNKQPHMGVYCGQGLILEKKEMASISSVEMRPGVPMFPDVQFDHRKYFNSGMWVGSRKFHADILWHALEIWSMTPDLGWHDQSPLNYAIAESKSRLELVDITWNYCFANQLHDWLNMKKYVYHFAGMSGRDSLVPMINWRV